MELFKQAWVTYLGMAIALLAIISGVFGWFEPSLVWGVAGMFGFGSIASLAAYIKEAGWMTYVSAGIPIILGLLTILKVITAENYQLLMAAFAPLVTMALQKRATR
jgi:uncharacterized membrane protein (UPF0136 family)